MKYIDQFSHLILDMGGVFMFDMDRFGPEDGLGETYQQIGGEFFTPEKVNQIISELVIDMEKKYHDPHFYDCFPSVYDSLKELTICENLPNEEIELLENVFTHHELGVISPRSIETLHKLATTHSLALISNIWASSMRFKSALEKVGIIDLFNPLIYSSDTSSIKPSPRLFEIPLNYWGIEPSQAAFIGDSLVQDIQGAKTLGMKTIWVNASGQENDSRILPDYEIKQIEDLIESIFY